MRIDMFVYNRCTTDARVLKEARTLAGAGHDVRILAVLDTTTERIEHRDGFRIVRIERNPPHYRVLGAVRRVGRVLRGGARRAARTSAQGDERGKRSVLAVLFAPLAIAARLLHIAARLLLSLLRGAEALARRVLLAPHKPLMFLDYYRHAYRIVSDDPPEALHAHDLNTLPVAAVLARRLRVPLVYDAHELYPEISTHSPREAAVWRFAERRLAGRATTVITVCESIAEELQRRYRVPPPLVLLNCPPSAAQRETAPASLHNRVGLPETEPIVLYQGGFAPNRGLETLVLAAPQLERGTVVLMGWGRIEDELRDLIRRHDLEGRVRLTEPVPGEEVVAFARAASIGVIPYEPVGLNNTYTTPNKLFDYMAAGLPIAASRLPELIRFVEGKEIGVTFTPGDPANLAAAINWLLADRRRHERMRSRALAAGHRHTWERESTKLVRVYERLRDDARP